MSPQELLIATAALAAYAASTAIEVDLPNLKRVSPSAAFGPPLAALGSGGYGVLPSLWLLIAGLSVQTLIVFGVRRRPVSSAMHTAGLLLSFALVTTFGRQHVGSHRDKTIGLLIIVGVASVAYFSFDLCVETLRSSRREVRWAALIDSARSGLPLAVVMASAAALVVLVYPRLSWAAFLVMFVPVLAARYEFARYGEAQRTYGETVRTLAALAEGAGYVPQGHQARVAELCVRIGHEMSLPADQLRELELVGLLHDVGAVSLSDPSEVEGVHKEDIARSTGHLLEETEYLSRYAGIVLDAARGAEDIPVEGRILRVADAYDELSGSDHARFRALAESASPGDAAVVAALGRVLQAS